MYKKISAVILISMALATGCKKDPGVQYPKDQYLANNYPSNMEALNSTLTPAYSNLRDQYLFGFTLLPKMLANCTHHADANYTDGDWKGFINTTTLTSGNGFISMNFLALGAGVKNANVALEAADFYEKNYAKKGDQPNIDYIRGQAYFLRAYYYFWMENLYGEDYLVNPGAGDTLGVPLFTKSAKLLAETQRPRAGIQSVWNQVISDLQTSATLLKGKVWGADEVGRVNEWAAKSLLGKVYVFRKSYDKALPVLQDVINNSGKSLMPYTKYRDAFIGITANEFNEESIFELNVDQDSKGGYGVFSGAANATTINGLIWPPYALGDDGTEGSSIAMGYGGNDGLHDRNVERFGYSLGSFTLVDNPKFNSSQPASYTNPAKVMDPVYKAKAMAARTNQTVDPRLYVNCFQPWLDSVKLDGQNWRPVSRPNYIFGDADIATKLGWNFRKYAPVFNSILNVGPADGANIYLLRLADVYLLYAEASIKSGDNATGLEYLNKVRRRAYNLPVNTPSAIDYKTITDATPAAASGDPVLGHNPLYYERWAELFNEGHWWFDICRWHLGATEAAYFKTTRTVAGQLTWDDKAYAWPLPITELNANPALQGKNNPGY
ncbi:RagB/SusD family nutrient uptake outer membrane protein [Chitinophaga sp. Cy-1792]|uniref:RagB/SusD family nutrient uptake outer membrane protein n=1 Tax=Chitinophaga sp. Cy-1792 TaxID=2608339 RepID=UPI00142308B5|nr:RagB/SusD family nutrient uptake outer membrane protein [Chitinophaga sp. Cy-1792]NIG53802.1 RagB/SusD family nutrient uptake outer membrane protein [Chitinophaga sp. Cy-1792]